MYVCVCVLKVNIKAVFIVDIKTNFNPETPDIFRPKYEKLYLQNVGEIYL